ncbi:hypothetical protein L7F22_010722 [Adiantum nelumboides]|nr:hypothetical protein [Adiantum nelumboides]
MKVRLLVNRATQKILYMEAGNDFVDLLLGFLQLPVASILGVFNGDLEVGSIGKVHESLRKLSASSLVVAKDKLLNPPSAFQLSKKNAKLLLPSAAATANPITTVYRCSYNASHNSIVSLALGGYCNFCGGNSLNTAVSVINNVPAAAGCAAAPAAAASSTAAPDTSNVTGFVQHYLSFIITDDLSILPASTIESIVLLNKLKVEKMADLDIVEAVVSSEQASPCVSIGSIVVFSFTNGSN